MLPSDVPGGNMDVSVRLTSCTIDCRDAVDQATVNFEGALIRSAESIVPTPNIHSVAFCLSIWNPLGFESVEKEPAPEFDLATGTYFVPSSLDYGDWIDPDWPGRIEALRTALERGLAATGPLRLEDSLRVSLIRAVARAAAEASLMPPETLAEVRSVYLVFTGDDQSRPGVAFDVPAHLNFGPWRFVEVAPLGMAEAQARYFRPSPGKPTMFRLFRSVGNRRAYHEAWIDDQRVVEHWGLCGETGENREHAESNDRDRYRLLDALRDDVVRRGYAEIPLGRQRTIVARRSIVGMGSDTDLDLRHELQSTLDEELGLRGLGVCDGGETGGGSMSVFCFVVDIERGMAAITATLADPKFRGFAAELLH
jgi:hypothetical protein